MSRTIRKDVNDKSYKEGRTKPKSIKYHCNCWLCTGFSYQEKQKLKEKIIDKEIKKEVEDLTTI